VKWEDPGSTALLVPVPEAEPVVGAYRRRHTPSGADGMPAHVTLLAPFARAPLLDASRLEELRAALAPFAAFELVLTRTARFGDLDTLYLVPEPEDRFAALFDAVAGAFGEYVQHPRFVPHVTVARSDDDGLLRAIERELRPHLPLAAVAREVLLMERGADRRWATRDVIELKPAS
jgi:2'-5' RNA ligase